jgi:hypothetical protein
MKGPVEGARGSNQALPDNSDVIAQSIGLPLLKFFRQKEKEDKH